MITSLELKQFKSFGGDQVHKLPLGPLSLLVGTNASGKSNVRDALRLLHGIGRGYTLAEILGEKYGEGGVLQWKGIRGGSRELVHGTKGGIVRLECGVHHTTISFSPTSNAPPMKRSWRFLYRIDIMIRERRNRMGRPSVSISGEGLFSSGKPIFSTSASYLKIDQLDDGKQILARIAKTGSRKYIGPAMKLRQDQPLVSQLAEHPDATALTRSACRALLAGLSSMRFLDLEPQALRRPSLPGQNVLGDRGENLSTVLQDLCEDKSQEEAFVEWTRELTPLDVHGLHFQEVGLDGKVQLMLKEQDGRLISADSASDGTMRFLAYAAALLGPKAAGTYVFEEIENGIHPNRVHLLLELLQKATAANGTQIIATTHSPALLNFLRGEALENVLLVTRDAKNSRVRRLKDLPLAASDRSVAGDLLESGWFENVTAYLNAAESEAKGKEGGKPA
jgi:predicted ATPase